MGTQGTLEGNTQRGKQKIYKAGQTEFADYSLFIVERTMCAMLMKFCYLRGDSVTHQQVRNYRKLWPYLMVRKKFQKLTRY